MKKFETSSIQWSFRHKTLKEHIKQTVFTKVRNLFLISYEQL